MIRPVLVANEMSGLKGRVKVASYPQRLKVDVAISGPSFGAGNGDSGNHNTGDERKNHMAGGGGDQRISDSRILD